VVVNRRRAANTLGIGSIILALGFWVYINLPPAEGGGYVRLQLSALWLAVAFLAAVVAGFWGTRLWFIACLGPLFEALFVWSLRA
jgi:hypothetical protein